jgi:hypothetical protein
MNFVDFHYYRLIFNNCRKLKKLSCPIYSIQKDNQVNDIKDCHITTLREIYIDESNDDITACKTDLRIFPNIEVLNVDILMYFSVHGILEKFSNLRHINVVHFRVETMLFVKLPQLKVLEIEAFYPSGLSFFWENLTENCCNIKKLVIKNFKIFILNESIRKEIGIIIKNLRKLKKLKYFEIASVPQTPRLLGGEDQPAFEHHFYKVIFENYHLKAKVIKVSPHFARHCTEEINILKKIFNDCEIVPI